MKRLAKNIIPLIEGISARYEDCGAVNAPALTSGEEYLILSSGMPLQAGTTVVVRLEITSFAQHSEIVLFFSKIREQLRTRIQHKVYIYGDDLVRFIGFDDTAEFSIVLYETDAEMTVVVREHTIYYRRDGGGGIGGEIGIGGGDISLEEPIEPIDGGNLPESVTYTASFLRSFGGSQIYAGRTVEIADLGIAMSDGVDYVARLDGDHTLNIYGENPYGHECRVLMINNGKACNLTIPEEYLFAGESREITVTTCAEIRIKKYNENYFVNVIVEGE
jgi:hypothetical protein